MTSFFFLSVKRLSVREIQFLNTKHFEIKFVIIFIGNSNRQRTSLQSQTKAGLICAFLQANKVPRKKKHFFILITHLLERLKHFKLNIMRDCIGLLIWLVYG